MVGGRKGPVSSWESAMVSSWESAMVVVVAGVDMGAVVIIGVDIWW